MYEIDGRSELGGGREKWGKGEGVSENRQMGVRVGEMDRREGVEEGERKMG